MKPFSPDEAAAAKIHTFPPFVIKAINELIATKYGGGRGTNFTFTLSEARSAILRVLPAGHAFEDSWLDFEPLYRSEGWQVLYDRPSYNESYEGFYRFTAL